MGLGTNFSTFARQILGKDFCHVSTLLRKSFYTEERGNLSVLQGRGIWEAGMEMTWWIISPQWKGRKESVLLDPTLRKLLQKARMCESNGVSEAGLHNALGGHTSHGMGPWASTTVTNSMAVLKQCWGTKSSGTPTQWHSHSPARTWRSISGHILHWCSSSLLAPDFQNGTVLPWSVRTEIAAASPESEECQIWEIKRKRADRRRTSHQIQTWPG